LLALGASGGLAPQAARFFPEKKNKNLPLILFFLVFLMLALSIFYFLFFFQYGPPKLGMLALPPIWSIDNFLVDGVILFQLKIWRYIVNYVVI